MSPDSEHRIAAVGPGRVPGRADVSGKRAEALEASAPGRASRSGDRALHIADALSLYERGLTVALRRPEDAAGRRRGWVVRRLLLAADLTGLIVAFLLTQLVLGAGDGLGERGEFLLFFGTLPGWVLLARLYRLYDRDEERTNHSTVDDVVGVFHLVTISSWVFYALASLSGLAVPDFLKVFTFWVFAIAAVTLGRVAARAAARRTAAYVQNTVVVGAGEIGQLVARKILQHPEYGMNVIGFVDADPRERRADLEHLPVLGQLERLPEIVERFRIDRVFVAFSKESPTETLAVVRALRALDVQIDIVPRLFEVLGPSVEINTVEGIQLVSLSPARLSRSSRMIKRTFDIVVAAIALVATAPLFAYIVWRVKRDSPGPAVFRQTRLGMNMKEFRMLKFRTMKVETSADEHREYIGSTMDARALPQSSGLYKLERPSAVTEFGRWLRKTSLDELPQLINVLKGDMSLVGPRPCIPYETDYFKPHHFERFLVPAGLTGHWQVKARAHSTFGEALDLDVAYARSWSFALDLRLLCQTPLQLIRRGETA